MNRSLPSMLALVPLALLLGLYMFSFQVRESEVAVVRTFGRIAKPNEATHGVGGVITVSGAYFRWPWPIQRVTIFDKRLHMIRTPAEEVPTQDGKPIILSTAIGWHIGVPYTFSVSCTDVTDAEAKLIVLARDHQKIELGQYRFSDLVSINPKDLKYDALEQGIVETLKKNALDLYGIEVTYARIDKLALPKQITEQVFTAMKSERQALAARFTSDGESQAKKIKSEAEGIADTILSFANRTAKEIEAEGLQGAAEYNQTFRQDEPLAIFLLMMENLPKILKDRTTIVFDQNSPLVSVLLGSPSTVPADHAPSTKAQTIPQPPESPR